MLLEVYPDEPYNLGPPIAAQSLLPASEVAPTHSINVGLRATQFGLRHPHTQPNGVPQHPQLAVIHRSGTVRSAVAL